MVCCSDGRRNCGCGKRKDGLNGSGGPDFLALFERGNVPMRSCTGFDKMLVVQNGKKTDGI